MDGVTTGIGLRPEHYQEILSTRPEVSWLEVQVENYFGEGGKPLDHLEQLSQHYLLSFHGVGLSLGSVNSLNLNHLAQLKQLTTRFSPLFVSEHLSWSAIDAWYLNDLLPLPYTEEALAVVVEHVNQTQDYLQHPILIENISTYLQFNHSTLSEAEFLTAVVQKTGCGILFDVNNLYVNCVNHGWNAAEYVQSIPATSVQEIHLAGFTENHFANGSILIDTHSKPVAQAVWALYFDAIQYWGKKPTLIEWDKDLPAFSILLEEAAKAEEILVASAR